MGSAVQIRPSRLIFQVDTLTERAGNFCVVVPAFNVERKIGGTLQKIRNILPEDCPLVVVDDGSVDGTYHVAKRFEPVLLQHSQNLGKGAAIRTGFDWVLRQGIRYAVVLDADGQHDPEKIPEFVRAGVLEGKELVLGVRDIQLSKMPADRWLSNRLTSLAISLACGRSIPDSQCGYRFVDLRRYSSMSWRTQRFEFESELLIRYCRAGAKIGFVRIPTRYEDEPSSIRRLPDTVRFLKMFLRAVRE